MPNLFFCNNFMLQALPSIILSVLLLVLGIVPSFALEDERAGHNGFDAGHDDSLPYLVLTYLATPDTELAEKLLHEILSRPDASIDRVVEFISSVRLFTPAPVGSMPSQSLQVRGEEMTYGLFVPSAYDRTKAFPLVVCLHGAGFTGDSYLKRWVERLGDAYILTCPTIPMGAWWTRQGEELVLATIRAVQARYHIDPDRIYLTGMSNGGIGAWIIGMHHAPRFAAVAPMASGFDDVLFPFLRNFLHTPLYVIHGAKDQIMPVWLSRNITNELTRLGIPFIYREHEWSHPHAGGHFFPRQELPDLVKWFGRQRRERFPKTVSVVRDASHLMEFGWVRIDSTDYIAMFSEQLVDRQDDLMKNRVYARLDVTHSEGNRIEVMTAHVRRYTLFLNDALVDFSHPITVVTNGVISFEGTLTPQVATLLREARHRKDFSLLFPARLTLDVSE